MDFENVVDFVTKFLYSERVVSTKVIIHLRDRANDMNCGEWMEYLRGNVTKSVYEDIRDKYKESMKTSIGFIPMDEDDILESSLVYDDILAI